LHDIQAVHYGHAARQFALRFHIDIVLAPIDSDRRVQSQTHGNRIRQADPILARLDFVSRMRLTVALYGEVGEFVMECLNVFDVTFAEHCVCSAELPSNQLHGKAAAHHDAGRFRIDPDVVLGSRCDVALAARRASHDHAAAHFCHHVGAFRQCQGNVGQRSQRNQNESRIRVDGLDNGIDRVQFLRRLARRRIVVVPQPVAPVKPTRVLVGAKQRFFRAREDRNIRTAKFYCIESVARRLFEVHISGNDGDRGNPDVGGTQRHDERDRVVGSCVGIDEKCARHERKHSRGSRVSTAASGASPDL